MSKGKQMDSNLLTTETASTYTGLARQTLAKLRVYGDGPRFAKLGRKVVYRKADLDNWINARLRESTSEVGA